jgi:hypothetical protein
VALFPCGDCGDANFDRELNILVLNVGSLPIVHVTHSGKKTAKCLTLTLVFNVALLPRGRRLTLSTNVAL